MSGSTTTVTRYGLGARGIDFMERTMGSTVTAGFPLYDAHGNMVATLARSGTNSYAVNDRRSYDAWGVVRYSQSAGDPKQRYCANLGHRADDETLLVYMRARYYDPQSGRFISQDPGRDGNNWFIYVKNRPTSAYDPSGRTLEECMAELFLEYEKARTMGPGIGLLYFNSVASNIVLDWTIIEREMGDDMMAASQASFDAAAKLPAGAEQDVALQIANSERNLAAMHNGEALLTSSVGMWTARMYAFMLSIDAL